MRIRETRVTMSLRLPRAVHRELKRIAKQEGISLTELMRRKLEDRLAISQSHALHAESAD